MTCRECFHWEACKAMAEAQGISVLDDFDGSAERCDTFVDAADIVPKSEVERLKKALEVQEAEYTQALHDKAREYNMVVDKICLEHRAEYARLHEAHQEELAKAKREVARKIFADMEFLIDKYSLEPNYLLLHLKKDIAEFKKQHNKI